KLSCRAVSFFQLLIAIAGLRDCSVGEGRLEGMSVSQFCLLYNFSFLVRYRALIFPLLIREGKPTPFFTFVLALLFCVYNGYLQGRSLSNYAKYPSGWLKDPCFITGFIGWLIGMAVNIHSDHILRNLRKPGETGYKIPRGGMFEYVSGANFFGEILEWFGFALACCTIESLAFALCTLFILGSRAKQHHQRIVV
uniref:3-oxo-5alpha-steroid 4-dehydrogenase (NADP(+)) n=1 Tax=Bubo bubo TaxID=30461 RepID=A0A8C0FVA9_BUBBB